VKLGKPKQDTRFDVPVFGMQTLEKMKSAGIGNVAFEAGSVLLLDKEQLLLTATQMGLSIQGFNQNI
jgi:DUF1009 family protein